MKKKSVITVFLALIVALMCCGCGDKEKTSDGDKTDNTHGGDTPREMVEETLTFGSDLHADKINFYGRCYHDSEKGVSISNSGAGFEVSFYGTELKANISATESKWEAPELSGNGFIYVFTDVAKLKPTLEGGKLIELAVTDGTAAEVVLATGLEEGDHTVTVYKATEVKYTSAYVKSVTSDGGFNAAPAKPSIKLELVGDSIMSGANAIRKDNNDEKGTSSESALASYGVNAAIRLGAQFNVISRSGLTVSGGNAGKYAKIADYYGKYSEVDTAAWDFTSYIPDAVVIDLGTNDKYVSTSDANIKTAYKALIDEVRTHYPQAYILCCTGAMSSQISSLGTLVSGMVDEYNTAGDDKVGYLKLSATSETGHPTASMHNTNAAAVYAKLKAALGL